MSESYRVVNVFNPSLDGIYVQSRSHEGQFVHSNGVYYLSRDHANFWLFTVGKAKGGAELLRSTSARLQPIGLRWISPQKIESQMTISFNRSVETKPSGGTESKETVARTSTTRAPTLDTAVGSRSSYKATERTSASSVSEFQDMISIRRAITPNISSRPIAASSSAAPRSASSTRPSTSINTPVWAPTAPTRLSPTASDADRYRSPLSTSRNGGGTAAAPATATTSHKSQYSTSSTTGSMSAREKDLPRSESLSRTGSQGSLKSPSSADKPPSPAPRSSRDTNTSSDYDYMYTSANDTTRSNGKYSSKFDAYEPPIPPVRQPTAAVTSASYSRHSSFADPVSPYSSHSKLKNPAPADSVDMQTSSFAQRRAVAEKARQDELEALTRTLQQYTRPGETSKRAGADDFWSAQTLEKVAASSAAGAYSPSSYSPNRAGNVTPPPQYVHDRATSKSASSPALTPPRHAGSLPATSPTQSISDRCAELLARTKAAAETMDAYLDKQLDSTRKVQEALGRTGSFSGRYNVSADEPVSAPASVRHSVRLESPSQGNSTPSAHVSSTSSLRRAADGPSVSPVASPGEHTRSTLYRPASGDPLPSPPVPVVLKPDVNRFSVGASSGSAGTTANSSVESSDMKYTGRSEGSTAVRATSRSPVPHALSHSDFLHRPSRTPTTTSSTANVAKYEESVEVARTSSSAQPASGKTDISAHYASQTAQPTEEESPRRKQLRQFDHSAPTVVEPVPAPLPVHQNSPSQDAATAHASSTFSLRRTADGPSVSPVASPGEHTRSTLYRPASCDPLPSPPVPVVVKPDVNRFSVGTSAGRVGTTANSSVDREHTERSGEESKTSRATSRSPVPLAPSRSDEPDLLRRPTNIDMPTRLPATTPIADTGKEVESADGKSETSARHSSSPVQPVEEETPLRKLLRELDASTDQAARAGSQAQQHSSPHTLSTTTSALVLPAGHPKSPHYDLTPPDALLPPQVPAIAKADVDSCRTVGGSTAQLFKTFSSSGELVQKDSDWKSGDHLGRSSEVRGSSRSPVPAASRHADEVALPADRLVNKHASDLKSAEIASPKLEPTATRITTLHTAIDKHGESAQSTTFSTADAKTSRRVVNQGEDFEPILVKPAPAVATVTVAAPDDGKPLPVSPVGTTQDSPLHETGALAMEDMYDDDEAEKEESSEDSCSSTASDTETESEAENEALLASAVSSGRPGPSAASPKITFSPKSLASKLLSVERAVKQQTSALASHHISRHKEEETGAQKVLPMELSKSFLLDKQKVSTYYVDGLEGSKVEVLVPAAYCAVHHRAEVSSQVILADNWEQIEPLWSQTVLTLDQVINRGHAQLQRLASAERTFTISLSDKVTRLQAQLQEHREKEQAAHKRAGTLLERHGDGHVHRDQAEGTADFPCGAELCAEYAAVFSNFESFARDAEATLQSLVSDKDCVSVLVEMVIAPVCAAAQQHVDDILNAKRKLLGDVFSVSLSKDAVTSKDSVPLQFWYATQQPRALQEVCQLTDEAVEKILHSAGTLVMKLHRAMQTAAVSGGIGDEFTLPELLRHLLRLYTVAALSDPRCFLHPAPGARLPYKEGLHQEILSPGAKRYGHIKEGDLVEVVLPGLYFDNPDAGAVPKMRSYVRRLI